MVDRKEEEEVRGDDDDEESASPLEIDTFLSSRHPLKGFKPPRLNELDGGEVVDAGGGGGAEDGSDALVSLVTAVIGPAVVVANVVADVGDSSIDEKLASTWSYAPRSKTST